MPDGTVKFLNINKGFGFIGQDDGQSGAFVQNFAVERAGLSGHRKISVSRTTLKGS